MIHALFPCLLVRTGARNAWDCMYVGMYTSLTRCRSSVEHGQRTTLGGFSPRAVYIHMYMVQETDSAVNASHFARDAGTCPEGSTGPCVHLTLFELAGPSIGRASYSSLHAAASSATPCGYRTVHTCLLDLLLRRDGCQVQSRCRSLICKYLAGRKHL